MAMNETSPEVTSRNERVKLSEIGVADLLATEIKNLGADRRARYLEDIYSGSSLRMLEMFVASHCEGKRVIDPQEQKSALANFEPQFALEEYRFISQAARSLNNESLNALRAADWGMLTK